MTDPPREPHSKRHTTPRWVKVFAFIAVVVVLLFVILLVAGGEHGPSRHTLPSPVTQEEVGPGAHASPLQHP
jgi:ABC-type transporter Mla subunit MlaD